MKTTLILKDDLFKQAARFANITQKTALVHMGLEALIEKYARLRLAALGHSEPKLKTIPRRRPK